jgi:hypothetical protein
MGVEAQLKNAGGLKGWWERRRQTIKELRRAEEQLVDRHSHHGKAWTLSRFSLIWLVKGEMEENHNTFRA